MRLFNEYEARVARLFPKFGENQHTRWRTPAKVGGICFFQTIEPDKLVDNSTLRIDLFF